MRIIYTSRLTANDLDDGAIALCCHLFQQWVPKAIAEETSLPIAEAIADELVRAA